MKKTISFILVALLLCGTMLLTACDSNSKAKKENEQKITEASTQPGEETTADTTGTTENPINPDDVAGSTGLSYQVNADGKTCTIKGIGTCTDTDVIIPKVIDGYTVTSIWEISNCATITSVIIPDSVTDIQGCAFENCPLLAKVTIGKNVTSIGPYAFAECNSLTEITIPDNVTTVHENVFKNCTGLTAAIIGNGVTSIGTSMFSGCTQLKNIVLGNSVTSIDDYAFEDCASLESIVIPNHVKSIGNNAFRNCTGLTSVTIGNDVTSIGNGAFDGCKKLTSIAIPDSVASIGEFVFYDCNELISVTLGSNVKSIGKWAFVNTNITDIIISSSVTNIGELAFGRYVPLQNIYYCDTATSWAMIHIDPKNDALTSATIYYYSASQPATSGNYWRYVNGVPTAW